MPEANSKTITVGVTGASGALLAQKMLSLLDADPRVGKIHLVITETGQRLLHEELAIPSGPSGQLVARLIGRASPKIEWLPNKDVGAPIASGSYAVDAMAVIPCSVGTLAKIAAILGQAKIGISSVIQPEGHEGESVPLILMIHDAPNAAMKRALKKISQLSVIKQTPVMFRVETFE